MCGILCFPHLSKKFPLCGWKTICPCPVVEGFYGSTFFKRLITSAEMLKKYSIYRKTKHLSYYKSKSCVAAHVLQKYPEKANDFSEYTYSRADVAQREASKWVMDAQECQWINYEQLFISYEHFDSILYDVQSLLHVALNTALETDEPKLFREMCHVVWCILVHNLNEFLSHASVERLTLILSFDGEGVPTKRLTQLERRTKKEGEQRNVSLQGISKYRSVLFGNNIIALKVQHYLVERLKRYHFKNVQH
ncbi:XRN_N domain-containing protein [Trichonephila clavipes]|nr:XRN_N domain-containing protein [Trichonephila clavipes]